MPLQANSLNKFSSYNYVWSLDVATPAEIESGAFRNKIGRIIKSGGTVDKNITTADEDRMGINVEYFIDNVMINSVVSPNLHTGVTFATTIEFTVIEPYSIGLFLQTLFLAATRAGYSNYIDSPFVLTCEFVGYDDRGNAVTTQDRRVLLIKLVNASFTVDAGGSNYSVQAITWGQQALFDDIQTIQTSLKLRGSTVADLLTFDNSGRAITDATPISLISELNRQEQGKQQREDNSSVPNEYVIMFATDPANPANDFTEIANSPIVEDFSSIGTIDFGIDSGHYNSQTNVYTRGNLTIEEDRVYQFTHGTKIEKIIEEVILTSEWGRNLINKANETKDGYINWFRIFTKTDILDLRLQDQNGSSSKRYTYLIYPYRIHTSRLRPRVDPINYNLAVRDAVKAYNYSYTGENLDIINFDIKLDVAFHVAIQNDKGQRAKNNSVQNSNMFVVRNDTTTTYYTTDDVYDDAILREARRGGTRVVELDDNFYEDAIIRKAKEKGIISGVTRLANVPELGTNFGGADLDTSKTRVARMFNQAIMNSPADLITLKLTIWGDPYYLSDDDNGNYIASAGSAFINTNGVIDYIRSEVDILLKFDSPVDYQNNLLLPNPANAFNGVYQVIMINSMFENGMFKQELDLVRRPNQDEETVNNANNTIIAFKNGVTPFITNRNVTAGDIRFFLREAEEVEKMFNLFSQIRVSDLASVFNINTGSFFNQIKGIQNTFDSIKQIRNNFQNLNQSLNQFSNLSSGFNLKGIKSSDLQSLLTQINSARDFFTQAFSSLNNTNIRPPNSQSLQGVNITTAKGASSPTSTTTNFNRTGPQ